MKVSIIIPIYNKEMYIGKCIESVLQQTYKNIEIILIDDGSTDKSLSICEKYAKLDDRIIIISQKNSGVSSARNSGLKIASGKKVVFIDADDYVEKTYINELAKYNEDLVICGYITEDNNNKIYNTAPFLYMNREKILNRLLSPDFSNLIVGPVSKLFDLRTIRDNNIKFNIKQQFGEDTCFIFNYLNHIVSVRYIDYVGYHNAIINGTLSRKYIDDIDFQLNKLIISLKNLNCDEKILEYWNLRNIKLIMRNECNESFKKFKKKIKNYISLSGVILKLYTMNKDCTIILLLKLRLYKLLYIINKFF